MSELAGVYHYHRVGYGERELELLPEGTIGKGATGFERRWELRLVQGAERLLICGDHGEVCRLALDPDGAWRGQWRQSDPMPVELIPRRLQPLRSAEVREGITYEPQRFHYISYAQLVQDSTALRGRCRR